MTGDSLPLEVKLLNIRDFSDFTLICRGRKFRLHKAIACAQSLVIATALREGLVDKATAGFLHVPFDLGSVRRLIEFLYTGNYQLSPDPALELLDAGTVDEGGNNTDEQDSSSTEIVDTFQDTEPGSSNGGKGGEPEVPTTVSERLTCHSRVDSVANYYDISALSELARSKVEDILEHEWSADAFCTLIQASLDATSDQKYHHMLAVKAVDHADELAARHIFDKGGTAEGLAAYMLPVFMARIKALEARVDELTEELAAEKGRCQEKHRELVDRAKALDACVQLVNANPRCRNCGVDFACTLEQTAWFHPRHILRCLRCSCRHEEDM